MIYLLPNAVKQLALLLHFALQCLLYPLRLDTRLAKLLSVLSNDLFQLCPKRNIRNDIRNVNCKTDL